jgi:hypothetical protein
MQWSSLGQSRAAVVGYNSEGNFFQNHPSSGFSTIADAISCGAPQKRRKRQNNPDPRVPMRFPTDPVLRMRAQQCIRRYLTEVNLFQIDPTALASAVADDYPCPPKLDQAMTDAARYAPQTISPLCFVSSESIPSDLSRAITVAATQQCCYDNNG